jgi:hypothetical protein
LTEIKSNAPLAEIPQSDQLFVQAVSEDLSKKLSSYLHPLLTASNDENIQRFSEMMQNAIMAENELQTIANVADPAVHRSSKPHAGRQAAQQRPGPHALMFNGMNEQDRQQEEHSEQCRMNTANEHSKCTLQHPKL